MSFLGSLVGRIEQGAQNAEHTIGNALNNAVHGGRPAPASTAKPQQTNLPVQPANAPQIFPGGYGNPQEQAYGGGGSAGLQPQPQNLRSILNR